MANRRSNRILGASRSNTHQSGNQSMNHGRQVSASFRPGGQHVVGEGTSGPSLEERIRKMEESQNEILQLLRETRQPALAPQEEVLLPQDPLGMDDVQLDHLHAEIPLPPLRRHPQSRQDDELADTASSTHPSYIGRQPRIPPDLPEDLAQPHVAELPRNTLRHELRRLNLLHPFLLRCLWITLVPRSFRRSLRRLDSHFWNFGRLLQHTGFRSPCLSRQSNFEQILLIHISAQITHLVVKVVKIREIKHLQQILFSSVYGNWGAREAPPHRRAKRRAASLPARWRGLCRRRRPAAPGGRPAAGRDPRQEKKKRRREGGKEEAPPRPPPEFRRRSFAGPPPDAGVLPDRHLTPEFRRTTT
ncbi:hypothetical protein M5K25_017371 [Dendrobium thyrsiflorum]|uniref:Uncharacterized protein n=1 Tax=Dendrobium thyrsiflorum TaxID=117978 RepID=A0ABD0UM74_DENTH